jgi:DHA1 family bicyclomycin/chloramphenicol resistance-like MFS transporter
MNVDLRRTGTISSFTCCASFATGSLISFISGFFHDGTARPLAVMIFLLILASAAALYGLAKPLTPAPAIAE